MVSNPSSGTHGTDILARGRDLVREYGVEEGIAQFVGTLDEWADAKRKKGNLGWLRDFLNRFGYQCKVAFYTCFANAWFAVRNGDWALKRRGHL